MASVKKTGSYWRVSYSVALPDEKKYRSRYLKSRQAAGFLKRQLERLEEATRTGVASADQITEWIGRGWLKREEAALTFIAWQTAGGPATRQAVDFTTLRAAYENYALTHSKAGDATRKSHRNHMGLADCVLGWLQEAHPRLDMTEADLATWLEGQGQRYSPWTVHHKLTKLRLLLDQAVRLGMLGENPARRVSVPTPRRTVPRRILSLEGRRQAEGGAAPRAEELEGGLPKRMGFVHHYEVPFGRKTAPLHRLHRAHLHRQALVAGVVALHHAVLNAVVAEALGGLRD